MNIIDELERIQKLPDMNIFIDYGHYVYFVNKETKKGLHIKMQKEEIFNQTLYRSIIEFDEKYHKL